MRRIREVLRLHAELGENLSAVAAGVGLARSTVRSYLRRAAAAKIDARADLSDEALGAALFPSAPVDDGGRPTPDWAVIDQELRRYKHVTRKLLWLEYKAAHPEGYEFSQFKLLLSRWQKSSGRGLSMRQVHRAGESVQVDYAGDTVMVMDGGVARQAQLFVACLPCSGLIYAEATWTQGHADWLSSHFRLFSFLAGVPAKIVSDFVPGTKSIFCARQRYVASERQVAILPGGLRARGHIIGYSEFSQVRRVSSSFQTERARGTAEVLQSSPQARSASLFARNVNSAYRLVVSRLTCPSHPRITLTSTPDSSK